MKLSAKGLATAIALLTGGCFLLAGLLELAFPGYGEAFLNLGASIYPGYHGPDGIRSVVVVTLYGLVDGAVGGAVLAWLYNWAIRAKEA